MAKVLDIIDVIHRSLEFNEADVEPLITYLKLDASSLPSAKRERAKKIASELRLAGSHDLASLMRGREGVDYAEVVLDVGKRLKAAVSSNGAVEANERAILAKLFEDMLEQLSPEERRELFREMNIDESALPVGAVGAAVAQVLLKQFGGFAVYRFAVIVANYVARALLGRGLSLAANAALTRMIGLALGPVGWIVSGAWLALDLAGPAYRKTVPAVVHVAYLRQMLSMRITIGIVGDGATGKDSALRAVFGIPANIDPVAGSTTHAEVYESDPAGTIKVVNYPGFNDYRADVEAATDDFLHHTDVFLVIVDMNRGCTNTDVEICRKVGGFQRPLLVCANKLDLVRPADRDHVWDDLEAKLSGVPKIATVFDPDTRIDGATTEGVEAVRSWLLERLKEKGKTVELLNEEWQRRA
ncbi:MAG: GTP-binding protein [Polyangiaceae bacterium]|nr:GTP-binding protein [Polyangiaceae bacterium]